MDKANLAVQQALYLSVCGPPPGGSAPPGENMLDWKYWEAVTGLSGMALIAYLLGQGLQLAL